MRFGLLAVLTVAAMAVPATAAAEGAATRGYLADNRDGSLVVFDPATGTITNRVALGFTFGRIAVRPDGAEVYVADWGTSGETVVVVDTSTHAIVDRIQVGMRPVYLVFTPDSRHVYIANDSANTMQVLDVATRRIVKTIPLAGRPTGVAVPPDGSRVYVGVRKTSSPGGSEVVGLSTATNTIVDRIPLPSGLTPNGVTVAPNGRFIVVSTGELIDTRTNTVVRRIQSGGAFVFTADSARIYVANGCGGPQQRGMLQVVDVATGAVIRTVLTSGSPNALALSPDGARLYVELFNDGAIAVVNTANDGILDRFGVADQAHQPELRGIGISGTVPAGGPGQRFAPRPFPLNLCDIG